MLWIVQCRGLLTTFFRGDHDPLRFPIDVCNCHRPERNQIDSRHELRKKRWQKFPVPAKKVNQHRCDTEIEYVINGRQSAFDKQRKNDDLECIRNDG